MRRTDLGKIFQEYKTCKLKPDQHIVSTLNYTPMHYRHNIFNVKCFNFVFLIVRESICKHKI